jgi:hypothetical protein
MSLYTLKELNSKPAEFIRALLLEGYRIVPTEQSNSKQEFTAVLTNGNYTVRVTTCCKYDCFFINFIVEHKTDHKFDFEESRTYYRSYSYKHGEVYSDSEKEAEDERIKYLSKCYEDLYLSGKFPKSYAKFII